MAQIIIYIASFFFLAFIVVALIAFKQIKKYRHLTQQNSVAVNIYLSYIVDLELTNSNDELIQKVDRHNKAAQSKIGPKITEASKPLQIKTVESFDNINEESSLELAFNI